MWIFAEIIANVIENLPNNILKNSPSSDCFYPMHLHQPQKVLEKAYFTSTEEIVKIATNILIK